MCYHVLNRWSGRAEVFHKDSDYIAMLRREACERTEMRLSARCLMHNHFHIEKENVPDTFSFSVQEFNDKREFKGHWFFVPYSSLDAMDREAADAHWKGTAEKRKTLNETWGHWLFGGWPLS